MNQDKADAIGRMYRYAVVTAGFDIFGNLGATAVPGDTSIADFAIAFQLAIWEIVEDFDSGLAGGGLGSGDGNFQITNFSTTTETTASAVENWFDILIGVAAGGGAKFTLGALTSETRQDHIILIPLPSSAGLAAAGLIGLAAVRRRRFH